MHTQFYPAIVENRNDPLALGRCQVRVFGVHSESLDDVPTSALPWAIPLMPITSASTSGVGMSPTGLVNGSTVLVYFQDGDSKQMPIMLGTIPGIPQNQNSGLKSGVIDEGFSLSGPSVDPDSAVPGVLVTSDGIPVTTSDGTPVLAGTTLNLGKPPAEWVIYDVQRCLGILKQTEGFRSKPYLDSAGVPTIGYGTTFYPDGKRVKMTDPETNQDTALVYVSLHIEKNVQPYIVSKVKVNITKAMFEALCSFIYNVGGGNFSKSTLLKLLNAKDYRGASAQFLEWTKAGGAVLPGLVTRRGLEKNLFDADGYPMNTDSNSEETVNPSSDVTVTKDSNGVVQSPSAQTMTNQIADLESLGFKDPAGKFPLKSTLKEPDTNRMFRRVSKGTIVERKQSNRRKSIQSPDGKVSFAEPKIPYNATYPYNRGFFTEGGHAMEFDDTPGAERVHIYHKSGTYSEIDAFGTQVNKIVGDGYSIIERNGYVYIDGTARIIVGSDVKLSVSGNMDVSVSGDLTYDVGGKIKFKTPSDVQVNAGGKITTKAEGIVAIDGSKTYLNSDKSVVDSSFARRTPVSLDYDVLTPETFYDGQILEMEDTPEAEVAEFYRQAVLSGSATDAELGIGNQQPAKTEEVSPTDKPMMTKSCGMFVSDNIPPNVQISKYFTIGMLSSSAVVSKYQIQAQRGLTIPEIACNIKTLAENTLDPIKNKYPSMMVTSGFRTGSGTSQHELGQAADMQFSGASKSEYYEIAKWIAENVPFDTLLLEYKTTGTKMPWIHVTFRENPRKQVFTYMNNVKKSSGLADYSGV